MNSNWLLGGSFAVGLIGLTSGLTTAATSILTIDPFSGAEQELDVSGSVGSLEETVSPGNALGGERTLRFDVAENPTSGTATAGVSAAAGGVLFFDLAAQVVASASLTYAGIGGGGLGGVDLTTGDGTAFVFGVLNLDGPTRFSVSVTDQGGNVSTGSLETSGGIFSATDLVLPYADFSNLAATDFTRADGIAFELEPLESGTDVVLSHFATGEPAPVPEPGAAGLLAATALAGALSRRRRRVR